MKKMILRTSSIVCLLFSMAPACKHTATRSAGTQSAWAESVQADGTRRYVIDWSCLSRQFGTTADEEAPPGDYDPNVSRQDEYCEWKLISVTDTQKICKFSTSFDNARDFYLNSRGVTPVNSIGAARQLASDCTTKAKERMVNPSFKGSPGNHCEGFHANDGTGGCVAKRNSDPEICDKVRWAVSMNAKQKINFAIDSMPPPLTDFGTQPLVRLGLISALPNNCNYSMDDKTEVTCTVAKGQLCASVASDLRAGIRVVTSRYSAAPVTPAASIASPGATGLKLSDALLRRDPSGESDSPDNTAVPSMPTLETDTSP